MWVTCPVQQIDSIKICFSALSSLMINRNLHRVIPESARRRTTFTDDIVDCWFQSPLSFCLCPGWSEDYDDARAFRHAVDDTQREMRHTYGIGGGELRSDLILAGHMAGHSYVTGLDGYAPLRINPVAVFPPLTRALVPFDPAPQQEPEPEYPLALVPTAQFEGRVGEVVALRPPIIGSVDDIQSDVAVVLAPRVTDVAPAFCARMALAITATVGSMADSPDNRAVFGRTYTRLCRDARVRHNVALINRPIVEQAYFEPTDSEVWQSRAYRRPLFSRFVRATRSGGQCA